MIEFEQRMKINNLNIRVRKKNAKIRIFFIVVRGAGTGGATGANVPFAFLLNKECNVMTPQGFTEA